ncbi:MAG: hypothetical protein HUJ62_05595 [Streptococcus gallolyticus]|nr:hypothetical protein [Streptococcus gallolyticus]
MDLSNVVKSVGSALSKNAPAILGGSAVCGVVLTGYISYKTAPHIEEAIEITRDKPVKDKIIYVGKASAPVICLTGATVACVVAANSMQIKRTASIATAYSLTAKAFADFKENTTKVFGRTSKQKIFDSIAKDKMDKVSDKTLVKVEDDFDFEEEEKQRCFDMYFGRPFKSTAEEIRAAENRLNKGLISNLDFVTVNDLYYELDIPMTEAGDQLGWDIHGNGPLNIIFSSTVRNDKPYLTINYDPEPKPKYNYWYGGGRM